MTTKFTIMGCGHSSGVPAAGGFWGVCDPNEPKNQRMRSSLLVQKGGVNIVIDTGADFRAQTIQYGVNRLDAILYTHQHSDHCHGIDDLRPLFMLNDKVQIPCYGSLEAMGEITERFPYLFEGGLDADLYPSILKSHMFDVEDYGRAVSISGVEVIPFLMDHGTCQAVGYRIDKMAYCMDLKSLDEAALHTMQGIEVLIIDGAGYLSQSNPVHADLQTIYQYNEIIGANKVFISSLSTLMDYKTLVEELPSGFYPAYDGLSFDL